MKTEVFQEREPTKTTCGGGGGPSPEGVIEGEVKERCGRPDPGKGIGNRFQQVKSLILPFYQSI